MTCAQGLLHLLWGGGRSWSATALVMLAKQLLSRKIYLCDTLGSNKNILKKLLNAKLKKRSKLWKTRVKVFDWTEKRKVLTISTIPEHDDSSVSIGKKNWNEVTIKKLQSVQDYKSAKKDIDLSDQMSAYHTPLKKSHKWYKKIAFEMLASMPSVNAFILYKKFYVKSAVLHLQGIIGISFALWCSQRRTKTQKKEN